MSKNKHKFLTFAALMTGFLYSEFVRVTMNL